MRNENEELSSIIDGFLNTELVKIPLEKRLDWFTNLASLEKFSTYMRERLGLDATGKFGGSQEDLSSTIKERFLLAEKKCKLVPFKDDILTDLKGFNAKKQIQKNSLDPESVAQDLFNDFKEREMFPSILDYAHFQNYCKYALEVEFDITVANQNYQNKELSQMLDDFFKEKVNKIPFNERADWFNHIASDQEFPTYMKDRLGMDKTNNILNTPEYFPTVERVALLEEEKHINDLKAKVVEYQKSADGTNNVELKQYGLHEIEKFKHDIEVFEEIKYQIFLDDMIDDLLQNTEGFKAKEKMQIDSMDTESVAQDLFNKIKERSNSLIDDDDIRLYCKDVLGIELDLAIANQNYSQTNENNFEKKTSNILDRIGNITNIFTAGQDKNKEIEKTKIFDDFLEQRINQYPFIERADKFLNIERKELNSYIREKFGIDDNEVVKSYSSELQKKVELAEQKHFDALEVAVLRESENPEDLKKYQKDIEAMEFTRSTYVDDDEFFDQAPSAIEQKFDSILNRTENIENGFVNQEDVKVAIEAIDRRAEDLLLMVDELEKKAAIYKKEGLGLDSLEVKELLKNCEAINTETMGLKEKYEKIQALPVQDVAINTQETENLSDVMQVVVLNEKGFYKELSSELNPDKFLSSFEIEKMAEGLSKEYPESKLMMIEVDRKKYTGIEGLSFEIAGKKDKMLREEGIVKFECKISKEQKEQKEAGKDKVKETGKKKIDEALKKVVAKEERNAIEIAWNWAKLIALLSWNFVKGTFKFFKPAKKEAPIPLKSKPETVQILALEQADGTIRDIRTEKNPSLFMDAQELKPYVDDLTKGNGKYILMEIPKNEFPSVNSYLKDGIMTDEGKEKYQEAKSEFLKGYSKGMVAYEVSDRPEIKPEEKEQTVSQDNVNKNQNRQHRQNTQSNKSRRGRGGKKGRR